jgi:hypothetical protein
MEILAGGCLIQGRFARYGNWSRLRDLRPLITLTRGAHHCQCFDGKMVGVL